MSITDARGTVIAQRQGVAAQAARGMPRTSAAADPRGPAAHWKELAYRRSLRLRPDCTEAWINLGRLFAESSDPDAARDCFNSALDLDPEEATALYNLGVLAQDAGREAEAIELYSKALALDPQLAEAHYNLATLFDQSGDSRAAIRHINEYRKLTR